MNNNKFKTCFVILTIAATFFLIYNIYNTYALLETDENVVNDVNTAKWNIKINDSILDSEPIIFTVDKIKIDTNGFVLENKLAPSTSGYFEVSIDSMDTDVSIRYDLSFDFSKVPDGIQIVDIKETSGATLIKTGENTYTNVITLKEIKENKKNNIRVNVKWDNLESSNEEDSKLGLVYNNKLDIPITIKVTQYFGEKIKEY